MNLCVSLRSSAFSAVKYFTAESAEKAQRAAEENSFSVPLCLCGSLVHDPGRPDIPSIPQQLVDRGLGPRLGVHALDDDRAVKARAG